MAKPRKQSAGLLMFRRGPDGGIECFLVHPGGPFWAKKDEGVWSIPKGEVEPGDELIATALREFEEEVGVRPEPPFLPLGSVTQKSGKVVHAWAFETRLAGPLQVRSNTFTMEWPPGSGRQASFPEVDKGEFFPPEAAKAKVNPAQRELIERLVAASGQTGPG